jgi:molecular chaperone DnaK
LIERNTTIPTKKSKIFTTAENNQPAVTIRVLQGERSMANDNTELGRFDLVGIPPAPRGVPQIEVTFDIDVDGIVHVSAKDKGTGKEQSIRITAPQKLSEEDIDKMVKDAEKYAEQDKKKREKAELRNKADTLVHTTEQSLKDFGDKISADEKKKVEDALADLKELLKKSDVEAQQLQDSIDKLTKASHKLAEEVYKSKASQQQQQAQAGGPQAGAQAGGAQAGAGTQQQGKASQGSGKDDDEVIDADYQEDKK